MLVGSYTPMKRIGMEELEGLVGIFERRNDAAAFEDPTPSGWMDEGAWLALHLILVGEYRYPEDFLAVYDELKQRHFGKEV